MAGATTTTIDAILKDDYLGPIRDNITVGLALYRQLQQNSEDVNGRRAIIPIHYSRNAGIGSVAEGGTLPTAGKQKFKDAIYTMTYLYGRVNITGQAIEQSKNDQGAFARALQREIQNLVDDFKNDLNRILNGDGTGTLTTVTSSTNTTTVQVASTRFLTEDMNINVQTGPTSGFVLTVDSDTQFTQSATVGGVAANFNVTNGDWLRRLNTAETDGLASLINNSGTVGTLARATNAWWNANVLGNSGNLRDLTLPLLQSLVTAIEKRTNAMPDFLVMKHEQRDKYLALLVADKRYVNESTLDGGFKTVSYNDIPIVVDKDALSNTVFGVTKKHFNVFSNTPMNWMDADGAVLSRIANTDAYEATFKYYWAFGLDNSRNQGRLNDLSEAV